MWVYFQVLKAIYKQEISSQSMFADSHVDDKYLICVEDFLKERHTIKRTTKKEQHMCDIYYKAKIFQK